MKLFNREGEKETYATIAEDDAKHRETAEDDRRDDRGDDDDEDDDETTTDTLFGRLFRHSLVIRYTLYIVPVAIILAIPIILAGTVFRKARIGDIRILGLFVWIELIWVDVWFSKLLAYVEPHVIQYVVSFISSSSRTYAQLFVALKWPVTAFF